MSRLNKKKKPVAQQVGRIPFAAREGKNEKIDEELEIDITEEVPEGR